MVCYHYHCDPSPTLARKGEESQTETAQDGGEGSRSKAATTGRRAGALDGADRRSRSAAASATRAEHSNTLGGGNSRRVRSQHICILRDIASLHTVFEREGHESVTNVLTSGRHNSQ